MHVYTSILTHLAERRFLERRSSGTRGKLHRRYVVLLCSEVRRARKNPRVPRLQRRGVCQRQGAVDCWGAPSRFPRRRSSGTCPNWDLVRRSSGIWHIRVLVHAQATLRSCVYFSETHKRHAEGMCVGATLKRHSVNVVFAVTLKRQSTRKGRTAPATAPKSACSERPILRARAEAAFGKRARRAPTFERAAV